MCGIVGILGREPVADQIIDALKRLEYRGYNSAGIAPWLPATSCAGARGEALQFGATDHREPPLWDRRIGHTRWATHGRPSEINAHPHTSGRVIVVHNGIIKTSRELRTEFKALGHPFSERDRHRGCRSPRVSRNEERVAANRSGRRRSAEAQGRVRTRFSIRRRRKPVDRRAARLAATRSVMAMSRCISAPTQLRSRRSPNSISYLEDGDWVVLRRQGAQVYDASGGMAQRRVIKSNASAFLIDKGNYRHFMAKEIHEQPVVVGHTLAHYLDMAAGMVVLPQSLPFDFRTLRRISIAACGTAYYAGLVAKYWFERFARLPVEVEYASEFRYRNPIIEPHTWCS